MFARMPVFSVQGHATRHQPAERVGDRFGGEVELRVAAGLPGVAHGGVGASVAHPGSLRPDDRTRTRGAGLRT